MVTETEYYQHYWTITTKWILLNVLQKEPEICRVMSEKGSFLHDSLHEKIVIWDIFIKFIEHFNPLSPFYCCSFGFLTLHIYFWSFLFTVGTKKIRWKNKWLLIFQENINLNNIYQYSITTVCKLQGSFRQELYLICDNSSEKNNCLSFSEKRHQYKNENLQNSSNFKTNAR